MAQYRNRGSGKYRPVNYGYQSLDAEIKAVETAIRRDRMSQRKRLAITLPKLKFMENTDDV